MTETREPFILIRADDSERKPMLFGCPKCGRCYSPKIYAVREELALEVARNAAATCYECRTHNVCTDCGGECGKGWLVCASCRHKKKLAACERVDPETIEECFGFDGGDFYASAEGAIEYGVTLVHPAKPLDTYKIDFDRLVDSILDGHHGDADATELVGLEALSKAVKKFNAAQVSGSYFPDSRKVADLSLLAVAGRRG